MNSVLVIDDDSEYRKLLAQILRQHGWRVFQAGNGDEGLALAREHLPEVVLCDLLMARINGFQVCRLLRQSEALRGTRVIVVSGRDFESDRQSALAAGADEYLIKPVRPEELLGALEPVAGKAHPARAREQSSGTISRMVLRFWGVRGSIPTPGPSTVQYGGNTSCVEIRAGEQIIILDAGTGLRLLGRELSAEFGEQPLELTLLLTHTHWDHIQGLPFFLPVYQPQNRLRILGYEGARPGLEQVLTSQMESPYFPIDLREVPANIHVEELKELQFEVGPFKVDACFAYHPGICVGYKLSAVAGAIAFFPDNELRHAGHEAVEAARTGALLEFARQENQKLIEFLRDTDVLIMDAQYDSEEYRSHIGWGHGCVDEVVELAVQARVKQLFLYHHDPDHDDAKITWMTEHARRLAAARGTDLRVDAAREGLVMELPLVRQAETQGRPAIDVPAVQD